jgi:signal transduction histidine kinase/DNA-binding response OmpR family regulator
MPEVAAVKILHEIYPMNFSLDETLAITDVSTKLKGCYPGCEVGSDLDQAFTIHMPGKISNGDDLKKYEKSLFLLIAKDASFALRGQFIELAENKRFIFVGAPWLAWMSEHQPARIIPIGDFPRLDSQMDQRFQVATQALMLSDLETLTKDLMVARDQADEANRVRSDFFAVMSHEIRTPLNGVISALSLMQNSERHADWEKLLSVAQKSASGLLNVINYTLDYSKIDAGRMTLEPIDFSMKELISSVSDVLAGRVHEKGLKCSFLIDNEVPNYLFGDEEKLRQVLINLAGNAVKFTKEGSVTVKIELAPKIKSSLPRLVQRIQFTVDDTGCGIPEDEKSKIFEPFWSGASRLNGDAGTGLGLNICERLLVLMEGDIEVKSVVGHGSSFSFTVPLETVAAPNIKASMTESVDLPKAFTGQVLVVDDNQTNLLLVQMILEDLNLSVRIATSGAEAVEIARIVPFDLILMDITMPEMDGIQAAKLMNQNMIKPNIVALTAHVGPNVVNEYLANGFKGYLRKPFDKIELIRELSLWLPASKPANAPRVRTYDQPAFNQATLNKMHDEIGRVSFERVRQLFLSESKRRLGVLFAAWVRRDHDAITLESHTLASSAASFGGEELAWRLRIIERASRDGNVPAIITHMKDIEAIANKTLKMVEAFATENDQHAAGDAVVGEKIQGLF